jgi:MFS superfamily sulfate permease-like transporter
MELKREVIELLAAQGISKYILITENVLNYHSSDKEYYQEWYEEVSEENGWIVALNMPEATQQDFRKKKLNYYIELMELQDWRVYKPYHLFRKIDDALSKRIDL